MAKSDNGRRLRLPQARPFQRFFQTQAAGGILLLVCACGALVAANSAWADQYYRIWSIPVAINLPSHSLSLSLRQWINEGLMSVFFLLVGLEIKREFVAGELSSSRQAALPIAGALGGMVVPAVLYLVINHTGVEMRGWAIPMATDIAFALGTLSLIAPTIPVGAKVFLTALAIVDDMGAVLVIALFYTHGIHSSSLMFAALTYSALFALNISGVRRLAPYLVLGVVLWLSVHQSGIHSAAAGVLLAFTIPTRTRINAVDFSQEARTLLDDFERTETGDYAVLTSKGQQDALSSLGHISEAVTAPLLRLEHALQTFSAFIVMPLFAFANAGVRIGDSAINWGVVLGIALGLALGKSLGITGAAFGAVALKMGSLPSHVTWRALHGCAWVGGIGFTMSLFIANLAFDGTPLLDSAKVGILSASVVAGIVGGVIVRREYSFRVNEP